MSEWVNIELEHKIFRLKKYIVITAISKSVDFKYCFGTFNFLNKKLNQLLNKSTIQKSLIQNSLIISVRH